nr:serine/threonine protein kinase [Deltaproteobacteria bacterium]
SLGNILIGYDGSVKVADFGIAKAGQRETETRSGVMKGKVAYMSPEGCVGQQVDRRSDVYALGVVLYELATVKRLFKGDNDFLTMSAIVEGEIPPPSTDHPDFPAELEAIIMKALARSPTDRYQTADELRAALNQFAVTVGLRTSTTGLADYMKSLFGDRPVPWLDEREPEAVPDFDTHVEGVVEAPSDVSELASDIASDAPLAVARTRVIQLESLFGAARRRKRLLIGGGAAAALLLVLIVAVSGSGGAAAPAGIKPASVKAIEPVAAPVAQPVAVPPPVQPDPIELDPIATGSAAKPADPRPRPAVKKPPIKRPPTTTKWDPNSLFPSK